MLNVANAIHIWHFQCKNLEISNRWNVHKALNDLYDSLREIADSLIETSLVFLGQEYSNNSELKFELACDSQFILAECVAKLEKMRSEYNEEGLAAESDIGLQDIYVRAVQAINKCLYQIK